MPLRKKRVSKEKEPKERRPITYEKIVEQVYSTLDWYATRFILISVVGVVIGVAAIIYAILAYYFIVNPVMLELTFKTPFQDISVFLGTFIGIGAIIASLVLLAWGLFWRGQVENRSIF